MSFLPGLSFEPRSNASVLRELGPVVVVLAVVSLWERAVIEASSSTLAAGSFGDDLVVRGLIAGALLVGGLAVVAGAYAISRGIAVGIALPSTRHLPMIGAAVVVPPLLVAGTKLVGTLTGVPYNSLTMTSYATNNQLFPFLLITGMGLLVAVPSLVLICQVVIQGTVERIVEGDAIVVGTALVAGLLLLGDTGGLAAIPESEKVVGAVLFVAALGLAAYGNERADRPVLRYLASLPASMFVVLVLLSGIAAIESVAEGLFVASHFAVLWLGAYTYSRSESMLVPAIAYLSLLASNSAVVFVFEAGMQSW